MGPTNVIDPYRNDSGKTVITPQSPVFHSSSYLPKLEASFMRDFTCCGKVLPNLHDLLTHYEENHPTQPGPNIDNNTGSSHSDFASASAGNVPPSFTPGNSSAPPVQGQKKQSTTETIPGKLAPSMGNMTWGASTAMDSSYRVGMDQMNWRRGLEATNPVASQRLLHPGKNQAQMETSAMSMKGIINPNNCDIDQEMLSEFNRLQNWKATDLQASPSLLDTSLELAQGPVAKLVDRLTEHINMEAIDGAKRLSQSLGPSSFGQSGQVATQPEYSYSSLDHTFQPYSGPRRLEFNAPDIPNEIQDQQELPGPSKERLSSTTDLRGNKHVATNTQQGGMRHSLAQSSRVDDMAFTDSGYKSAPSLDLIANNTETRNKGESVNTEVKPPIEDDQNTVFTGATSVMPNIVQQSIVEVCKGIYSKIGHNTYNQNWALTVDILPSLVKAFAIKLGSSRPTEINRHMMYFIYKHHR